MVRKWLLVLGGLLAAVAVIQILRVDANGEAASGTVRADAIKLPDPRHKGDVSLEQCLLRRRSVRTYKDAPLTLSEVGQLLWAAQGITASDRFRTAPSAGALYPLETYVVAGNVDGLSAGVYKYRPGRHDLMPVLAGDIRKELASAALGQESIRDAAIDIVFSAVYARTAKKYGQRATRYVHMEAGHAGQNVCLQATAMRLGVVTIGAFHDAQVKQVLKLPDEEEPLYVLPVGKR